MVEPIGSTIPFWIFPAVTHRDIELPFTHNSVINTTVQTYSISLLASLASGREAPDARNAGLWWPWGSFGHPRPSRGVGAPTVQSNCPQLNCLLLRFLLPNLLRTSLENLVILDHIHPLVLLDLLGLPFHKLPSIRHIRNTCLHLSHTRDNSLRT